MRRKLEEETAGVLRTDVINIHAILTREVFRF